MFIKTLKAKIYKKMTASDNKSYLSDLNKLVDQYNDTIIILLVKSPLMLIILLWLKKLIQILRFLFKVNDRVRITKSMNIFS